MVTLTRNDAQYKWETESAVTHERVSKSRGASMPVGSAVIAKTAVQRSSARRRTRRPPLGGLHRRRSRLRGFEKHFGRG